MSAHGDEFLASLDELFEEAGADGRDAEENFLALREPLITFVRSCAHKTSAKARASLDLAFTDGTLPNTFVQFFPGPVKLDDAAVERLRATVSGDEFVDALREVIRRHQFRPLKRKIVEKALKNVAEGERKKRVVKLRVRSSAMSPPQETVMAYREQCLPTVVEAEHAALKAFEPMEIDTPLQDDERMVDTPMMQTPASSEILGNETPQTRPSSPVPTLPSSACSDFVRVAIEAQIEGETTAEFDGPVGTCDAEAETAEEDEPANGVVSRLETTADNAIPTQDPPAEKTPAMNGDEILDNAVILLQDEIACIPFNTWLSYSAKLVTFFNKAGTHNLDFAERIHRIARICFDPEEAEAVHEQDWERLKSAVRLCAVLAEATCPENVAVDHDVVNDWVVRKFRNVEFLKKLLGSKERVGKLEATSPTSKPRI